MWISRKNEHHSGVVSRRARHRSGTSGGVLRAMLLTLLVLCFGMMSACAEEYEIGVPVDDRVVDNLHVTDVYHPGGVRIQWDYEPMGGWSPIEYLVKRDGVQLGTTTNRYYVDNGPLTVGVTHSYSVWVVYDQSYRRGLPAPPPNPPEGSVIYQYEFTDGSQPEVAILCTLQQKSVSENAAADSRWDLRYGNPTPLDFTFGTRTYRGGLWAGYATDPSRVGRSYLKFLLDPLPNGQYLWAAGLYAYYTRSAFDGTTQVGAHWVTDAWSTATLKWSNAPSLTPSAGSAPTYSFVAPTTPAGWAYFRAAAPFVMDLYGDLTLSYGIASKNETSPGWVYFAKKEYDAAKGARILYAHGAPHSIVDLLLDRYAAGPGETVTGTVYLNAPAPTGGAVVTLNVGNEQLPGAPNSTTVPAGQMSATFTFTVGEVPEPTLFEVTARYSIKRSTYLALGY